MSDDKADYFPPRASSSTLSQLASSTKDVKEYVFEYLKISRGNPSRLGTPNVFGTSSLYYEDVVSFTWPRTEQSPSQIWTTHCMVCTEAGICFDDKATKDDLRDTTFEVQGRTNDTQFFFYHQLRELGESDDLSMAICAFGIADTNPYQLSEVFPYTMQPRKDFYNTPHMINSTYPATGVRVDAHREMTWFNTTGIGEPLDSSQDSPSSSSPSPSPSPSPTSSATSGYFPPLAPTSIIDLLQLGPTDIPSYLNLAADSAHRAESGTFGDEELYIGDLVMMEWLWNPSVGTDIRQIHCLPCREENEWPLPFNYTACSHEKPRDQSTGFQSYEFEAKARTQCSGCPALFPWVLRGLTGKQPGDFSTAVCAFSISSPWQLTKAFPFINRERSNITGSGPVMFNSSNSPSGRSTDVTAQLEWFNKLRELKSSSSGSRRHYLTYEEFVAVVFCSVLGFLVLAGGLCCWGQNRRSRTKAARHAAEEGNAPQTDPAQSSSGVTGVSELPKYQPSAAEAPPAYTAIDEDTQNRPRG